MSYHILLSQFVIKKLIFLIIFCILNYLIFLFLLLNLPLVFNILLVTNLINYLSIGLGNVYKL